MNKPSNFEQRLEYYNGRAPLGWHSALIDVADTAQFCKQWLEENTPGYTSADVLTMTKMVIRQRSYYLGNPELMLLIESTRKEKAYE